jgi:hypothetical protein
MLKVRRGRDFHVVFNRIRKSLELLVIQLNQLAKEINLVIERAKIIQKGLDDLKLGDITVDYKIIGRARSSYFKLKRLYTYNGTIGKRGKDKKRLIATREFKGKYTRGSVKCYSYRGYRTSGDKDRTQGRGIPVVMRSVSEVLR